MDPEEVRGWTWAQASWRMVGQEHDGLKPLSSNMHATNIEIGE